MLGSAASRRLYGGQAVDAISMFKVGDASVSALLLLCRHEDPMEIHR